MRERAPAFRSADHNADSACKLRLDTKGEAEAYILTHAAFEVNGYVTGRAIPCGDAPNCRVVSNRKVGGPVLTFPDGSCVLLDWRKMEGEAYPNWAGYSCPRDRASICAGRDERLMKEMPCPVFMAAANDPALG